MAYRGSTLLLDLFSVTAGMFLNGACAYSVLILRGKTVFIPS
jgi:hypothetical protein